MIATPSQTVGPFFAFGLTTNVAIGRVATPEAVGEHISFRVRLVDGEDTPLPDAMVELWQADATGAYGEPSPHFNGFGRLGTDVNGVCAFETIRPGAVTDDHTGDQASHINLCLFMRGLLRHLYTRAYFAGDPAIERDAVSALVPQARRHTLIAQPVAGSAGAWTFDVRLQGENETVFFDV